VHWEKVSNPCRNFCFLGTSKIVEPQSGNEMLALASYAYPDNGALVLVDATAFRAEIYKFPMDDGSWPLLQIDDGSLLLGSNTKRGALMRFDMMARKWREPLEAGEQYIWSIVKGSNRYCYCATYPGCLLLQYDANAHSLKSLGRCSDIPGNIYAHRLFGDAEGKIYINCLFEKPHIACYDIHCNEIKQHFHDGATAFAQHGNKLAVRYEDGCVALLDEDGNVLEGPMAEEEFSLYPECSEFIGSEIDPRIHAWKDSKDVQLFEMNNGDKIGKRGQDLFILRKGSQEPEQLPIGVEPPITDILSLCASEDGKLWGSSNFGMTIFSYDPKTGEYWNSDAICYDSGGEVYGMAMSGGKLYMSAYANGGHLVYDTKQPWDAWNGVNPRNAHISAPKYNRPEARSVIDNNGYCWTGLMAGYGVREMAVTRWDTKTDEVKTFEHLVPNRTPYGLDTDGDNVWITTSGAANGLSEDRELSLSLLAFDSQGNILFEKSFEKGIRLGRVCFSGKFGLVSAGGKLFSIDAERFALREVPGVSLKRDRLEVISKYDCSTIAAFDEDATYFVNPMENRLVMTAPPVKGVNSATVLDGEFYANSHSDLLRLAVD
jgi:hypothetical protein